MAVEVLDQPPPDDGMTIDGGVVSPLEQAGMPISKLPSGQQFEVLKSLFRADADHSHEWRGNASEWFAFRAGEQWSDADKAMLRNQQRPHIVFNRVLTILKAVAGMEINGRHEITFMPRGTEDTAANEVINAASKWMADCCDGEDEESEAFDHTTTCGMGFAESRMSYEDDAAGLYVEEAVDPREMYWDRTAKKKNLKDARRMSRARRMPLSDALAMFPGKTRDQLDAVWANDITGQYPLRSIEERRRRDTDRVAEHFDDLCEVTVVHIQWIERETYYLVADVQQNSKVEMSEDEYKRFEARMKTLAATFPDQAERFTVHAARLMRKVYKAAWLGGDLLEAAKPAPIKGKFSWDCITGEYDVQKGTWFGLVKVLRDPQMWANKWLSQILHILNTTAKGGILAELTAFDDQTEAENSYAQADQITWVTDGALSGQKPKVMPKPGTPLTDGYVGLLTFAISSFKDVSGINLELLGQQDQNQPGILEAMRKQAGMTVLATLFDALRNFRKQVGRSRLYFIQNFLSDGRLIRVAGPSISDPAKAVRLVKEKTTGIYDVVVADTPTSPNQKEANWAIIQPLLVAFRDQLIQNPEIFVMLLEYSPLPSRIVEAIRNFIMQQKNDPQAQQDQQIAKQLGVALTVSEISKNQSIAEMNNAKAGSTEATAMYDIAMAKNMLAKNDVDGLRAHLDAMEVGAKAQQVAAQARKTDAETAHTHVKTAREAAAIDHDALDARTRAATAAHELRSKRVGMLIDNMAATAGVHRDLAGAAKDHAQARLIERTPERLPAQGA